MSEDNNNDKPGPARMRNAPKGNSFILNVGQDMYSNAPVERQPSHLPENEQYFPQDPRKRRYRRPLGIEGGYIVEQHEYLYDSNRGQWYES